MLETLRKKENISLEKGKQAEVIAIRHQIMSLSQKSHKTTRSIILLSLEIKHFKVRTLSWMR